MIKPDPDHLDLENVSIEELRKRVAKAKDGIAGVAQLLAGYVTLTSDERRHSDGRMRIGEKQMLGLVLDVVDVWPQYFVSLADEDQGMDPNQYETQLLRDRLERIELVSQVFAALSPLADGMSDESLHLGEQVRPPILAAYAIARVIAKRNPAMRSRLAPVLEFYSAPARRASKTKADKKAANSGSTGSAPGSTGPNLG